MKNTFGSSLTVTIFGESHGAAVGAVLDGLAPGIEVNEDFIAKKLSLRRPSGQISTARVEKDNFRILSGVYNGFTTGTPLCIVIPNENTKSADYSDISCLARPGHADFTARFKYGGYEDFRGGGHFSGRITAAIVAAGALVLYALEKKGILIGTHIMRCAKINDRSFENAEEDIKLLSSLPFPSLDGSAAKKMQAEILKAKSNCDSVGGILETAVLNMPKGVGEPWFDSLESIISHIMFSIPAVKGIEFGDGFGLCDMSGSEANDEFYSENGEIFTKTNHNGGINGGISNGMPIIFRTAVKPTPSIFKPQHTVNIETGENTVLNLKGRHDPAIIHRAAIVATCAAAIAAADMLTVRFGTDFLSGDRK